MFFKTISKIYLSDPESGKKCETLIFKLIKVSKNFINKLNSIRSYKIRILIILALIS